ncbi:hypothetical protein HRQ91_10815 [Treponema parvum]|uniref:Esterase n=1 Tax=Treponema parvum TaxID=138851 RepID=A0A975IG72_9SPIR|nr:alpha/beta hydrolase family protein [Treponema parvum]QTQ14909.1 hypothetical protein HRQ91_10815 [Treponema parvum]
MPHLKVDFISYTLKRNVAINVMIPGLIADEIIAGERTHRPKAPYPVLYLLHGYWGDSGSWERYTSVERYAEEYGIAIVTMSAENNFYVDMADLDLGYTATRIFGPNYWDFLEKELPDFLSAFFPLSKKAQDTYIAGLSMGGYGALIHGFSNPAKFRAVGAFSPPTTLTTDVLGKYDTLDKKIVEKYEPINIIKRQMAKGKKLPALYYSYGSKDFLVPCQDWFENELVKAKFEHTYKKADEYAHEWPLWDKELDGFLAWLPRTDIYHTPGKKRKV